MTEHRIIQGDVLDGLRTLPDGCVQMCCTSPPYWGLRNYGVDGQIGLEKTPEEYVAKMVEVFREVRRVLRDDGTLWLNLGDSYIASGGMGEAGMIAKGTPSENALSKSYQLCYMKPPSDAGLPAKNMVGIPWRVAFALQADGWYLRSDIIWAKRNCMPESVTDRPTKSHEYIFLLTKKPRYFYDGEAIREPAAEPTGWDRCREQGKNYNHTDGFFKEAQSGRGLKTWKRGGNKQDQTGNPTYTGFNDRGKQRKDAVEDYPGSPMYRGGTHNSGLAEGCGNGITRNKRTVWWINPQPRPEAHFATFPDELAETCIKAGTSEYGCCPKCGAPWERQTEPTPEYKAYLEAPRNLPKKSIDDKLREGSANAGHGDKYGHISKGIITTGWQQTCSCEAGDPVPCTVLDPFMGSGTVAVIARDLNRSSIGIELNPKYVKIIKERLQAHSQLDTGVIQYRFEQVPV